MRSAESSGEMPGVITRARTVTVGQVTLSGPLVELWGGDEYAVAPVARAMLGSGLFSRFSIVIDEPGGVFVTNSTAAAQAALTPFDSSGLWLVLRNKSIVVRSVVHGSPADAAGIETGDAVVGIDGKPVFDLDSARALLMRPSGTKMTLTYQRGAARREVALTLWSLI